MIPTILYAFDNNPLITAWNKRLAFVTVDGVRFSLIDGPNIVGDLDVYRSVLPFGDDGPTVKVKINDSWNCKIGNYAKLAKVLGLEENLNSRVTFLKPMKVTSNDAMEEIKTLGGDTFILRPINGTRSIDAFVIKHTEKNPFRFKQFMQIYQGLWAARINNNIVKEPIKDAFREIGVEILSNTTWQEFRTSMSHLTGDSKYLSGDRFFLQTYEDFHTEYRIIKAAPGSYFGYKYGKTRGWKEDLKLAVMQPLDDLLCPEMASELKKIFESDELPFMCSIDIGLTKDSIVVHEFSPEFMITEYGPHDLNTLVEAHLRGIIALYRKEMGPTVIELPSGDYSKLHAIKAKFKAEKLPDEEFYLKHGVLLDQDNAEMYLTIKTAVVLCPSGIGYYKMMEYGYESVTMVQHPDVGLVEVYVKQ